MKSPSKAAHSALRLLLGDLTGFPPDARILRFVMAEMERGRLYTLPLGGEVDRNALLGKDIDFQRLKFDRTSFLIHFNVTDEGYNPANPDVSHTTTRLALVQDLADPRLLKAWRELFGPSASDLSADSLLVVPINRVSAPGIPVGGPGNRGWALSWTAAHIHRAGPTGKIESRLLPTGVHLQTTLAIQSIAIGDLGRRLEATFRERGTIDTELARETMLEVTATLDLGLAMANQTANLRRSANVDGDTWQAGKGPRAAPKAH